MKISDLKKLIAHSNLKITISRQCELLGLSKSAYYYKPKEECSENLLYMRLLDEQYLKTPYTYSRAFRVFENINYGNKFPFKYDRPHNLNVVMFYQLKKNIAISGNFVLMSGYNTTFAKQHFSTTNLIGINSSVLFYDNINNLRTPIYHRADISINFKKQKKRGIRTWSIGIYNFYNRLNPYVLDASENGLLGTSIFPIIPSISYSFKF